MEKTIGLDSVGNVIGTGKTRLVMTFDQTKLSVSAILNV